MQGLTPSGWPQRATQIARDAESRVDAFYLVHAQRKREQAAEEGLTQLDGLEDGAARPLHTAVEVTRAVARSASVDGPKVCREALRQFAANAATLAGPTTPVAALALRLSSQCAEPDGPADAAFAALPADSWTSFLGSLPETRGVPRLQLAAQPLPDGAFEDQCKTALADLAFARGGDVLPLARHLVGQMARCAPQDVRAQVLERVANLSPTEGLTAAVQRGLAAASEHQALPALARAVYDTAEGPLRDALATLMLSHLPADSERDALAARLQCSDAERLDLRLDDGVDLVAIGRRLLENATDPARGQALLTEAAHRADDAPALKLLCAAAAEPLASAAQQIELQRAAVGLLEGDAPPDLAACTVRVLTLIQTPAWPEDSLRIAHATLPVLRAVATTPEQMQMIEMLDQVAQMPTYEAESVRDGIVAGLTMLGPDADPPPRLVAVAHAVVDGMNYWVDQANASRICLGVLARAGDPVLADCAHYLQRLNDEVDVSSEEERAHSQIEALGWIAENGVPVSSAAALGQLASATRQATESEMRDIRAGQLAAEVMGEIAVRDHNGRLAAEAALLTALATMHNEYVGHRLSGLYAAMEAQRNSSSEGVQRLAAMASAALQEHDKSPPDRAAIGMMSLQHMAQLARSEGAEAQASALEGMVGWIRGVRYDKGTRCHLAEAAVETITEQDRVTPGALADVAWKALGGLPDEDRRAFTSAALDDIERTALAMGDRTYVPQLVAEARKKDDTESLRAALVELQRFSGKAFDDAVAAGRTVAAGGTVENRGTEVIINGIRVPVSPVVGHSPTT